MGDGGIKPPNVTSGKKNFKKSRAAYSFSDLYHPATP